MKRFNIALWVSCLALLALIASCGSSNIGSPIQDDLNAGSEQPQLGEPPFDPGLLPAEGETKGEAVEIIEEPVPIEEGKESSFLPGGFAWCYSGWNTLVDHHFNYTARWGSVIETTVGPVKTVHLRSSSTTIAGVRYWFKKGPNALPGERIRRLEFHGTGKNMQVHLYNFTTGAYDPYVTFNLDDAPMLGFWPYINVGPQHVDTSGRVVAEVRSKLLNYNKIVSIRTDVY
ncbi:hypothetical protein IT575_02005 [bacterium]|nr:hypothetical protein [bacterium]